MENKNKILRQNKNEKKPEIYKSIKAITPTPPQTQPIQIIKPKSNIKKKPAQPKFKTQTTPQSKHQDPKLQKITKFLKNQHALLPPLNLSPIQNTPKLSPYSGRKNTKPTESKAELFRNFDAPPRPRQDSQNDHAPSFVTRSQKSRNFNRFRGTTPPHRGERAPGSKVIDSSRKKHESNMDESSE